MSALDSAEGKAFKSAIAHLELIGSLERDASVRDRLANDQASHVLQIAKSAVLLLDEEHGLAFNLLLRALTDSIFRCAWGLSSEANAASLEREAHNDFRRNVKSLISTGQLSFIDEETRKTLDGDIIKLAATEAGSKSKNVRAMAEELDLELLYQLLYKPLSMQSHGSYGVVASSPPIISPQARFSALLAAVQIIAKIAGNWLALRQPLTSAELKEFFFKGGGPNNSFKPNPLRESA